MESDATSTTRTERLDEVLGQEEVYLVKHPSGRTSHKIHVDEDCQYLHREDSTAVSKPASAYPAGFHDICGVCGKEVN